MDSDAMSMGVAALVAMYVYESFNKGEGKKKKRGISIWDSLGLVDIVLVPILAVTLGGACLTYYSKLSQGNATSIFSQALYRLMYTNVMFF
jgi:hypothetical protein